MKKVPSFPRRILLAAAAVCAFCTGVSAATVDERPAYYVEWLGASGTQNLDTEYVFKNDPRVETTMMLLSNADKDVAGMPAANASCFIIDYKDSAKTIYYRYHASGYTAVSYPDSIQNQWVDVVWGSEVRQNGTLLKSFATQDFSDNTASFHLFYARSGMNGLRFKRVRMYDGGALIRDLHPAVMADGTPCMYDSVTDKCYLNSGTGAFSTGDRVTSSLTVEGSPYTVGVVTPPYGCHEKEMTFGLATNCTAPATVSAEGISATCAGYRFYRWSENDQDWALESSGAGNSHAFSPTEADAKIVWLWNVAADLALSVDGSPSSGANSITFPVVVRGLGSSPSPAVVKAVWGYAADALAYTNTLSTVSELGPASVTLTRLQPGTAYFVKLILESQATGGGSAETGVVCAETEPLTESLLVPGLWQTFFTSADKNWTKDIWAVPEGTDWRNYTDANRIRRRETTVIAPYTHGAAPSSCTKYVSEVWGDQVWWPVNGGQWVYAGWIWLDASKAYKFRTKIDDNERIQIVDAKTGVTTTLINDTGNGNGVNTSPAYTPSVTGWHAIELRFSDGSGGLGGYDSANNYVNTSNLGFSEDGGSTWGLLKDPGDGSLLCAEWGEAPIVATEVVQNGALASVSLDFDADGSASRTLMAAWGPAPGGDDPADWARTGVVATIPATDKNYVWAVPADWGSDSNLVVRFYFDGTSPQWSNHILWRDCSTPRLTDVEIDGAGGDTLVVSGDLASFPGRECALTVFVGDSPSTMTNVWRGLAGATRTSAGAFTLTLFEPDAASPRYLAPGSTCYVSVEAVSQGKTTRSATHSVMMKAAPAFDTAAVSASVSRRTATFSAMLRDLGANGSATVALYVGSSSDDEADFVPVEPPVVVTGTSAFTIAHTFDDFETTYKWQLRAVSTTSGGARVFETRTDVATLKTLDTTTYTWKTSVAEGDWSNPANWTDNQGGDCLGYPQSSAATATFAAEDASIVRLTQPVSIGNLNLSAANLRTVFVQGGASTNATRLTTGALNVNGAGGEITFSNVAVTTAGTVTVGGGGRRVVLRDAANFHTGNFESFSGGTLRVESGSWLSANELHVGGNNGASGVESGGVVISNATVFVRGNLLTGYSKKGGAIRFEGVHPVLFHGGDGSSFRSNLANAETSLDFLVPVGGYAEPPIRCVSTQKYLLGNNGNNGGSSLIPIRVLADSPATRVDETVTTLLVAWSKGVNTAMIFLSSLADVPVTMLYGLSATEDYGLSSADAFSGTPFSIGATVEGSAHGDRLTVSGTPEAIPSAAISPAYGNHDAYTSGETITATAPATTLQLTGAKRATVTGGTFYTIDPVTRERDAGVAFTGASYTYETDGAWHEIEWAWDVEYLVTTLAGNGGTVSSSEWVSFGDTATISATPAAGGAFSAWQGGAPLAVRHDNPCSFVVTGPVTNTAVFGAALYVSKSGSDSNGGTSWDDAFLTIPKALTAARAPATVFVGDGVYTFTAERTVSSAIAIVGAGATKEDVVIERDASSSSKFRLFTLNHADAVLRNLTLRNGYLGSASLSGGNVLVSSAGGSVIGCAIRNGTIANACSGGNIHVASPAGVVRDCLITGGSSYDINCYGGYGASLADGLMVNCVIVENYLQGQSFNSSQPGGAVYLTGGKLLHCTVAGNRARSVAGVYAKGGSVVGCLIAGNDTYDVPAGWTPAYGGTVAYFAGCASDVRAPLPDCIQLAAGDLDFADPYGWDYALPATSACIDAGIADPDLPVTDYAGNPRVRGAAPDLGAIELAAPATIGYAQSAPRSSKTVAFTAVGATAAASYAWDFGDGATATTQEPSATHAYADYGAYTVTLTPAGGEASTRTVYVRGERVYVSPAANAGAALTFATPETATSDLVEAIRFAEKGGTIILLTGDHRITAAPLQIGKDLTLLGETGVPEDVHLLPASRLNRVTTHLFTERAALSGITVMNGYSTGRFGGGVHLGVRGGVVTNCVLRGNQIYAGNASGGGVYVQGPGLVSHCVITNNMVDDNGSLGGCGVAMTGPGLVENCLIALNKSTLAFGTAGRSLCKAAGGVYMSDGVLLNCTIAGNRTLNVGGVYLTGGAVTNCVITGNTSEGGDGCETAVVFEGDASRFVNCASADVRINDTCAYGDCELQADFTTGPSSVAIDAGVVPAGGLSPLDLAGNPRVSANGLVDAGCYEYSRTGLAASFTVASAAGLAPFTATVTPSARGAAGDVSCSWNFGDGSAVVVSAGESPVSHTYAEPGDYTITMTASDGVSTTSFALPAPITVRPEVLYVSSGNAAAAAPYDTWANAAANLPEAVAYAVDGCRILIAAGTYTLDARLDVSKDVAIHGVSGEPEDVVLTRGRANHQMVTLNHPDAVLANVVVEKGTGNYNGMGGANVQIAAMGGTLTNCVIRGGVLPAAAGRTCAGGGIYVNSHLGYVGQCVVTNNQANDQNSHGGTGVFLAAGLCENTLIAYNIQYQPGNPNNQNARGAARADRGAFVNCTIVSNSLNHIAGAYSDGGAFTNCVISHNHSIVTKTDSADLNGGVKNDHFVNCASDVIRLNDTCVAGDLDFVDFAGMDFHLGKASIAIDAGCNDLAPGLLLRDLDGNPRVSHRRIDIGCYERVYRPPETVIILR